MGNDCILTIPQLQTQTKSCNSECFSNCDLTANLVRKCLLIGQLSPNQFGFESPQTQLCEDT